MSLGLTEIALILVVVLVLFGGKRIPELAKALGKAQYEYKKAKEMLQNEAKDLKDAMVVMGRFVTVLAQPSILME